MTLTGNYLKFQDLVLFYLTFYGFVACTRVNIIICELIKNVIQYCIIKEKRLMVTGQDLLLFFKTGIQMYACTSLRKGVCVHQREYQCMQSLKITI